MSRIHTYVGKDTRTSNKPWRVQMRVGPETIDIGTYVSEHVARIAAAQAEAEILQRLRRETPIDRFLLRAAPCRPWHHDPMRRMRYVHPC